MTRALGESKITRSGQITLSKKIHEELGSRWRLCAVSKGGENWSFYLLIITKNLAV